MLTVIQHSWQVNIILYILCIDNSTQMAQTGKYSLVHFIDNSTQMSGKYNFLHFMYDNSTQIAHSTAAARHT
jgi:hypothetical protein